MASTVSSFPLNVQKEANFSGVYEPEPDSEDVFTALCSGSPNQPQISTNCRLVGAPRVCFARNGHFIQIENQVTSTGRFKGTSKINTLKSYHEKQDLHPLSDSYRTTLESQLGLQLKQGGVLFQEYALLLKAQLTKTGISTISSYYLKSELLIWQLCEILWPAEIESNEEIQNDEGFLLIQRQKLSDWLVKNGPELFGYGRQKNEQLTVFKLLKMGRIDDACKVSISKGNAWLPVVLSCAGNDYSSLLLDFEEITSAFKYFPEDALDIFNLCNGSLALKELNFENVSTLSSHQYLQYFSLYLWYYTGSGSIRKTVPVDQAIRNFEEMMRKICVDSEAPLPRFEDSSVSNLCVHLLKLYSCTGYPVKKLMYPVVCTKDSLDYKLNWFLMMNLEAIGYIPENEVYEEVCSGFVGQLEAIVMPEWAVYVTKVGTILPEVDDDEDNAMMGQRQISALGIRLLEKYIGNGDDHLDKERFLVIELGVNPKFIYKIKGETAAKVLRYDQMIGYWLKMDEYQKAFNAMKDYLDYHCMDVVDGGEVGTKYIGALVKHLQTLYPFRGRIAGWGIHGELMVNFVKLRKRMRTGLFDDDVDGAVIRFMKAIASFKPKNGRQCSFLVDLALHGQKVIEHMLVSDKVAATTKDKIKDELITFISLDDMPLEYFEGLRGFIRNLIFYYG